MIVWGTIVTRPRAHSQRSPSAAKVWCLSAVGIGLALYVFMTDSLGQLEQLKNGAIYVLPTAFNWPLFCAALVLMAAPLAASGVRPGSRSILGPWLRRPIERS